MAALNLARLSEDADYRWILEQWRSPPQSIMRPILDKHLSLGALENWAELCQAFATAESYTKPIHERVIAWNPQLKETQKVKALWTSIMSAIQQPETDRRERVIASLVVFLLYLVKHDCHAAQLALSEEIDYKQNDSEPPLSPTTAPPPSTPAVVFADFPYSEIRGSFSKLVDVLADNLVYQLATQPDSPTPLEDWQQLCSFFKSLDIEFLRDQINAWQPEHAETQKVKALWLKIQNAFLQPDVDQREQVITNFCILIHIIATHDLAEENSQSLSPIPSEATALSTLPEPESPSNELPRAFSPFVVEPGFGAPPTSPVEFTALPPEPDTE